MKALPLLLLPVFLTSCSLIQLPARLINSALGPLVENDPVAPATPSANIALRLQTPSETATKDDQ